MKELEEHLRKVLALIEAATVAQEWMNSHHPCEEQDCDLCNSRARLKSALEDMNK